MSLNGPYDRTAANMALLNIAAEGSLAVAEFVEITFTGRFFP